MQVAICTSCHARPVRAIAAAIALLLLGACSSSPKSDVAPVKSSPFYTAGAGSTGGVQINTLRTFGDSYTDFGYTDPRAQPNWSRELVSSGLARRQENYAVGGARAQAGTVNAFDRQVANWDAVSSPVTERDLSIAYFGYNDIGRTGATAMGASKAGYTQGVNALVARGAAAGNNRIFVTQIHDWSRNPGVEPWLRGQIIDWNNHVASVANSNPNIIAVDLFTVFNRVFERPQEYGLVNATTVDKERSYTDFLFFDSIHFGSKGQEIISRVFRHYLTRGWNWASALDAGGAATAQLNKDLDENLVAFQFSKQAYSGGPLRLLPLTSTHGAFSPNARDGHALNRQSPGATSFDSVTPMGLAFDIGSATNGPGAPRVGLALTRQAQSDRLSILDDRSSMRMNSSATTLYWLKPHGNLLFSTQMSRVNHGFDQSGKDDLLNRVVTNERQGHTWALESRMRYTFRASGATMTPWVSLHQRSHTLDGGTHRSVYTTDVQYFSTKANDLYSGLGLDVQLDPLTLADGKRLQLSGNVHHTQSIRRDALYIRMREQISPDVIMTEIIERPEVRKTTLGFNARLDVSKQIHLNAGYAVDLQNPGSSQFLRLTAGVQF